jgi:TRAP-type transport system periplasmic protein
MKRVWCIGFVVVVVCATACAVSKPHLSQEKTIALSFASFFPPTHKNSIIMDLWCKEVTRRTNRRVEVKYYPGGTLTPAPQTYDAVAKGDIDVGEAVLGYTMGKFPLSEVLDYPIGHFSAGVSTKLVNVYFQKFKPKEFDEVKAMYFHCPGPGLIHSRKPINKLEDLKGLRLRAFGSNAEFVRLLGSIPIAMPMSELYDAINKGFVDGFLSPYDAVEGWKLDEVIKYHIEDFGVAYSTVFIIAMNKDKWAAISPDDQKIIDQINQEWMEKQVKIWDEIDISGKAVSQARGNYTITLSPEEEERWKKATEPLLIRYVNHMQERGLPGAEVLKFAREYLAAAKNQMFLQRAEGPVKK